MSGRRRRRQGGARSAVCRSACFAAVVLASTLNLGVGVEAKPPAPAAAEEMETPRALPPEEAVARTLASQRYRFCFDRKYPLWDEEVRWCALLPRSPDPRATRCPGFADACRAGATARLMPRREPLDLPLPDFGGIGQMVLWGLAAAAVAGLVFLLARAGMRWRAPRAEPPRRESAAGQGPQPSGAANTVEIERDVDRLLARARAAAARGDFAAAVSDLRAALLRRLEGDGHVRIHPSATNGDYVRELRQRAPALASPVDQVVREVERVEFGDGAEGGTPGTSAAYQSVLARVQPLLLRSAGRVAVLLAICLLGTSCQPPQRPDWASSPSGSAALAEFLSASGLNARERIHPLKDLVKDLAREPRPDAPRQVLVLPDALMGEPEWTALRDWLTDDGHTLVVAAGGLRLPSWLNQVEAVSSGATEELTAAQALGEDNAGEDDEDDRDDNDDNDHELQAAASNAAAIMKTWPELRGRVPGGAWLRTAPNPGDTLIARGKRPYALLIRHEDGDGVGSKTKMGRVIVLADERLLTNASLVVADNAALLFALLLRGNGPVEIVNAETGLVAPNPVAAVRRGRMAPFLLQLGACLVLFLLLRGRAFGRLVDRDVTTRRAFSEHVRALGTQYARGRAAAHVLGSYAAWATDRLRERIRLSGPHGVGDLAGAVAARTGRPLGDVARVLFAARREGDSPEPGPEDRSRAGAQQQLTMMRELAQLLTDTHATSGQSRRTAAARAAVPVPAPASVSNATATRTPTQKGIPIS